MSKSGLTRRSVIAAVTIGAIRRGQDVLTDIRVYFIRLEQERHLAQKGVDAKPVVVDDHRKGERGAHRARGNRVPSVDGYEGWRGKSVLDVVLGNDVRSGLYPVDVVDGYGTYI